MTDYLVYSTNGQVGLIEQVKVALDENVDSTPLASLGDIDTLKIDEIIRSKIEDAARLIHLEADHSLLDEGIEVSGSNNHRTKVVGGWRRIIYTLPDNFLRLVSASVSGWDYPVTEAIDESSPFYAQQFSLYGGIHGNPQRPVAAIVRNGVTVGGTGKPSLVLLSIPSTVTNYSSSYNYIPRPTITLDGDSREIINLCPKLMRAVVYRTASLAAQTLLMGDAAALLLATSNNLAGIPTDNAR